MRSQIALFIFSLFICKIISIRLLENYLPEEKNYKMSNDGKENSNDLNPPKWRNCDPKWGNDLMGTSKSKTMCTNGEYVTLIAMYLSTKGYQGDPGTLNKWLTDNQGYDARSEVIWKVVDLIGLTNYKGQKTLSFEEACAKVQNGNGLICQTTDPDEDKVLIIGCNTKTGMYNVRAADTSLTGMSKSIAGPFHIYE